MNSVQISGEDVEGREDPFAQQMWDRGALEGLIVIYVNSMQNHAKKKIITNSFPTCFGELV